MQHGVNHLDAQPEELLQFPVEVIQHAVCCVQESLEINLRQDIMTSGLDFHNNKKFRSWDYIFTRIVNDTVLISAPANRGSWEMALAYDPNSQTILCFMREKRFAHLQATRNRRARMHYIDALAKAFNIYLEVAEPQTVLFEKEFIDENQIEKQIAKLLSGFDSIEPVISHFAIVLFEAEECELLNIRVVAVSPKLDIVEEQNWNEYMSTSESPIVQRVTAPEAPAQNPARGLKLKDKAQRRKKSVIKQKQLPASESGETIQKPLQDDLKI